MTDESAAEKASTDLNKGTIGSRYVEISIISYGDYLAFNDRAGKSGNTGGSSSNELSQYLNDDNTDKAIVMRGLPYKIQTSEVVAFFDGYGKMEESDVHVEEYNGRRTGSALVFFESAEVAQDAKAKMNKQTIGSENRWVELYDSNDAFMRKICGLPPLQY